MAERIPRIAASSYSNTAPLIWSFLYGSNHGKAELTLDNAPARSAELLSKGRVDAALVPVIASQFIDGVKLYPDVCVGAETHVKSVCIVSRSNDLNDVRSVSLDTSSRTSAALVKIIFREFLSSEPEWCDAAPDIDAMLAKSDAALLIGDPALSISPTENLHKFDLAEIWHSHTGLGFVFAMWMTCADSIPIDLAQARDEGMAHIDDIVSNYMPEIRLSRVEMAEYLSKNISYSVSDDMRRGMELYLKLAAKHGVTEEYRAVKFLDRT
jgi:chorismate dehydratase